MALLTRTFRWSLLEARSALPPTYLLPFRATITTVSHNLETGNIPEPLIQSAQHISQDLKDQIAERTQSTQQLQKDISQQKVQRTGTEEHGDLITPSIRKLLPLLQSQPSHYVTAHIHGHPYLITHGDTVRLPFLMPDVKPGDVLRLNRATHIGSRDYTLKAPEAVKEGKHEPTKIMYLDDRLFTCKATVVGIESEPMRVIEKTKRRQRHIKHVRSKHRYTVLRISELSVKSLDEYEQAVKAAGKQ